MANSHWWRSTAGYLAQSYQALHLIFQEWGKWSSRSFAFVYATEVARALEILEYERIITIGHSYAILWPEIGQYAISWPSGTYLSRQSIGTTS